jgi:tetratricopeptide (TPR) repeat protein
VHADALAAPDLAAYPAVYREFAEEHHIAANGAEDVVRRTTVRIQSEAGASWYGRITVPIRSRDAAVRIAAAMVRQAGGGERQLDPAELRESFSGAPRFRSYLVPGVRKGDEIVSETRVSYPAAAGTKWWLDLAPIFDLPVRSGMWTVTTPAGASLNTDVFHDKGHREMPDGTHAWQLAGATAAAPLDPWIGLSTFATWNEVALWLHSLATPAAGPAVRAEARRLAAAKSGAAAVDTLCERVARGVRLIERSPADSGFKARAPKETLADGEGDALSKQVLLASLLAAQGIRSGAAYVSRFDTLDVDFPSPGQLGYVVTRVEDGDRPRWLDAAPEVGRAGALPSELRGRHALLVSARGGSLVKVPPAPPGFNRVRAQWSGKLDAKGAVLALLHIQVSGDPELALRRAYGGADPDAEALRVLAQPLRTAAGGASHSAVYDLGGPLTLDFDLGLPQFLDPLSHRAGARFQAIDYGQDCHCAAAPAPAERAPLIAPPFVAEETFDLKLPQDVKPLESAPVSRAAASGYLHESAGFSSGIFRLRRSLAVHSAEGAEAQQFLGFVDLDLTASLAFEHTAAIDAEAILKSYSNDDLDSAGYDAVDRDPETARVILEYATRRDPQSKYSWNNLGRAYEALGRFADALRAYDRQIEVNPKDGWAYNNRGLALSRAKRDAEAIYWFERQLEIAPDHEAALRNLGHSYVELEWWEQAEPYLNRALALRPEDTEVLVDLGQALSCRGDLPGAKEYFNKAVGLSPFVASAAARALARCGAALDYAQDLAVGALHMEERVYDATRNLQDWPAGLGAQIAVAASLEAVAEVALKANRATEAKRWLDAATALASDEDLALDVRNARIALGRLREAAEAQADAQQLAGSRRLEVPEPIAELAGQAAPQVDRAGWRRRDLRRRMGSQPASHAAGRAVLACGVSPVGTVIECRLLDADIGLAAAAFRDAALVTFPRVEWRGKPEATIRLIRLEYGEGGRLQAFEAASLPAMAEVRRMLPQANPAGR